MSFLILAFINLVTFSNSLEDLRDITDIYKDYLSSMKELEIAGTAHTDNKFDLMTKLHKEGIISYEKRLAFQKSILENEGKKNGAVISNEEFILNVKKALEKARNYNKELSAKFFLTPFKELRKEIELKYEKSEISQWDFYSLEKYLLDESKRKSRELYLFEPEPIDESKILLEKLTPETSEKLEL